MMRLLFPMHLFQEEDIPGRMKGRNGSCGTGSERKDDSSWRRGDSGEWNFFRNAVCDRSIGTFDGMGIVRGNDPFFVWGAR